MRENHHSGLVTAHEPHTQVLLTCMHDMVLDGPRWQFTCRQPWCQSEALDMLSQSAHTSRLAFAHRPPHERVDGYEGSQGEESQFGISSETRSRINSVGARVNAACRRNSLPH